MKRYIYCSKAYPKTDFEAVLDILTVSTNRNKEHGISGMLVFDGTYFLQMIEGDDSSVNQLKSNLLNDPRHYAIETIDESSVEGMIFPSWGMGYMNKEQPIVEVCKTITGSSSLNPSNLTAEKAILILIQLSNML